MLHIMCYINNTNLLSYAAEHLSQSVPTPARYRDNGNKAPRNVPLATFLALRTVPVSPPHVQNLITPRREQSGVLRSDKIPIPQTASYMR